MEYKYKVKKFSLDGLDIKNLTNYINKEATKGWRLVSTNQGEAGRIIGDGVIKERVAILYFEISDSHEAFSDTDPLEEETVSETDTIEEDANNETTNDPLDALGELGTLND